MARSKKNLRHESLQKPAAVSKAIASISRGLAKGRVKLSDGDEEIVLRPKGLLRFKVKAAKEENRREVNIRINWSAD